MTPLDHSASETTADRLSLLAIDKTGGIAFVEEVLAAYGRGEAVVLTEPDKPIDLPGAQIVRRVTPAKGGGWIKPAHVDLIGDEPAQVTFTSGTTGEPKGIVLPRRALGDVTSRLIDVMQPDATLKEYVGVPPHFSFGLARFRAAGAVGGSCYLPEQGFNPIELRDMLDAGEVNALSAVPTLLRMLMSDPQSMGDAGAKLRWLEIGSQSMSRAEKEAIKRIFPNAKIVQHYGLTEASRSTFLVISDLTGVALESVGVATGDMQVRINGDDQIEIKGPNTALGVLTPGGIAPVTDGEGWLTTSDLGHIVGNYVYFDGRADDIANIGGIKIAPDAAEKEARQVLPGANIAAARVPDPLRGHRLVLAAERESVESQETLAAAARQVAESLGLPAPAIGSFLVDALPRTGTGKVQRGRLADLYAEQADSPEETASHEGGMSLASSEEERIAKALQEVLGGQQIGRDQTFYDLGGDSLSAINLMLQLDKAGLDRSIGQQLLAGQTIAEIASGGATDSSNKAKRSVVSTTTEGINAARGLMMIAVITSHWLPFVVDRTGALSESLAEWLRPLYRMGTPGFALIYGVGLGFFAWPLSTSNPGRFHANQRFAMILLGSSILLLGGIRIAEAYLRDIPLDSFALAEKFWSVLVFYLISTITLPALLRLLRLGGPNPQILALVLAFPLLTLQFVMPTLVEWQPDNALQMVRLIFVSKYGFFGMTGIALLGMFLGLRLYEHREEAHQYKWLEPLGVLCLIGAVTLMIESGLGFQWFKTPTNQPGAALFYFGVVALSVGLCIRLAEGLPSIGLVRRGLQLLAMIGVLSLFFYVAHELVMPPKELLETMGLPLPLAIAIPMLAFVVISATAVRRLDKLYHGEGTPR
ncbi:MAG: AMP-binding protein [Pseudomonadota bacterium]